MKSSARVNGATSCRRPVVSLSHTTKSYRVNRPLVYYSDGLSYWRTNFADQQLGRIREELQQCEATLRDAEQAIRSLTV